MIRYTTFLHSVNGGFDPGSVEELSSAMPPSVAAELYLSVHEGLVRKVAMFAMTSDDFIRAIVVRLKTQAVLKEDYIFRCGDPGDCMFFVGVGIVDILSSVRPRRRRGGRGPGAGWVEGPPSHRRTHARTHGRRRRCASSG